ncbi:MAG: hypothetical protein JWP84_4998 [Tardiphaga sp.]|nr:hypothetical protein [Tardiphaga sp.]
MNTTDSLVLNRETVDATNCSRASEQLTIYNSESPKTLREFLYGRQPTPAGGSSWTGQTPEVGPVA